MRQKAVINAEADQIEKVERLVSSGLYRSVSEFVREAIDDRLRHIQQEAVAEAVERYCAAGHADEDLDIIAAQAFDVAKGDQGRAKRRRGAGAKG